MKIDSPAKTLEYVTMSLILAFFLVLFITMLWFAFFMALEVIISFLSFVLTL